MQIWKMTMVVFQNLNALFNLDLLEKYGLLRLHKIYEMSFSNSLILY